MQEVFILIATFVFSILAFFAPIENLTDVAIKIILVLVATLGMIVCAGVFM